MNLPMRSVLPMRTLRARFAARRRWETQRAGLLGPMMPHLAETGWRALGHETLVAQSPWPVADAALVQADSVTIAVQINGKLRGTIHVAREADEKTLREAAFALDGVKRALDGKEPRRVIIVPGRIVNIVP